MSPIQSNTQQGIILLPAATDLSASVGCFAMINSSAQVALPSAGGHALFVIANTITDLGGTVNQVECLPLDGSRNVRVIVGVNGVTAADAVTTLATGKAVKASSGNVILGIAEETGVAGQYVLIRPIGGRTTA